MKHLSDKWWTMMLILVFIMGISVSARAEKKPYKLGCNFEMTGPFANFIKFAKNGMILEQERINAQGGIDGHPLELVFEDNGTDVTKAANIHVKFARDKEIKAIVGPLWSIMSPTLYPISEREKIPHLFMCAPSAYERNLKRHWIFHTPQGDIPVAERLMDLIKARGYNKVFAFHDRDQVFMEIAKLLKQMGQRQGIEVFITNETYQSSDTDMTPQILNFKNQLKAYDAIYLGTNGATGSVVIRNLLDQGIRMPVIGTHAFGFEFTLNIGKEAVEGVEFVSGKVCVANQLDDGDPQKPVLLDFDKRMKARWGMAADQVASHAYDSIWILYHSFKRAGEDPTRAQLRDAIEKTENLVGCGGTFNYSLTNHDGLDKKSLAFIKIENNKFTRIKLPEYE